MSTAERIEDFIEESAELANEAAFVEAYPFPFLVREATRGPIPVAQDRTTARLKKASVPIGDGFAQKDLFIHRVCPRDPENNQGAVTLGREEDCDVVVDDGSISSLHASFTLEFEDDQKIFYLHDNASSNGTFLNGDRIAEMTPTQLSGQDSIRFGPAVKFQFFTAEGFFQFLSFYQRI